MLGFRAGLEQHGLPLPEFEKPFHLLPLLRPLPGAPFASAPPEAELAYFESHRPARIAFRADGVDWIATTHVLPAAYPRTHDDSVSPPSDPVHPLGKGMEKAGALPAEIREAQWALLAEHTKAHPPPTYYPPQSAVDAERDAERRQAARHPQLWSVFERIVPRRSAEEQAALDREGSVGLTIVAAHPNGFHKETYEPCFHHLVETLAQRRRTDSSVPRIDELWSMDTIDSGDSGLLNQQSLGQCIHWMDHPRDILNFVRFYLPKPSGAGGDGSQQTQTSGPARCLPRLKAGEGLEGRKLVLMGQSFSGNAVAMLSVLEPKLAEHYFLLDPVVLQLEWWEEGFIGCWPPFHVMAKGAVIRQEVWSSAEAALANLQSKQFYAVWDPRTLELFVRFGLRPVHPNPTPSGSGGPQTLSMNKWREAEAATSNWLTRYVWALLERNRGTPDEARNPVHLYTMSKSRLGGIFAEDPEGDVKLRELISAQTTRSTAKMLRGGHLVVQEQPALIAAEIADVLCGSTPSPKAQQANL